MKIFLCGVYRLANGDKVLITGQTKVGNHLFFRGVTQRDEALSFDENGNRQAIPPFKPGKDIVDRVYGEDDENFKIFTIGSQWVTHGQRVWEVVAISRDKNFPIIANEILPDGSFHENIRKFNWDGRSNSATVLHRRIA